MYTSIKTRKKIKDGYGDKNFLSNEEYDAIRFIDNGGKPNKNIKKKNYKFVVKEYKRHLIILILWYIKKSKKTKDIVIRKIAVKNEKIIYSKLNKMGWRKLEKLYEICLEYSNKRKTRKILK